MTLDKDYKREVQRKLIHLSTISIVFYIYFFPIEYSQWLFGILYSLILGSELLRTNIDYCSKFYKRLFIKISRRHETNKQKPSFIGTYYVLLAIFIAVVFFSKETAIAAIAIMTISDTCAALVGRKFGNTKILNKSLEGSIAFMLSGFITIYSIYILCSYDYNFLMAGFVAVIIATFIELISKYINIDDNLTVVLAMGISMEIMMLFLRL